MYAFSTPYVCQFSYMKKYNCVTRNPGDLVLKMNPGICVHIFNTLSKSDIQQENIVIFQKNNQDISALNQVYISDIKSSYILEKKEYVN